MSLDHREPIKEKLRLEPIRKSKLQKMSRRRRQSVREKSKKKKRKESGLLNSKYTIRYAEIEEKILRN
jgi:hypothetical protein